MNFKWPIVFVCLSICLVTGCAKEEPPVGKSIPQESAETASDAAAPVESTSEEKSSDATVSQPPASTPAADGSAPAGGEMPAEPAAPSPEPAPVTMPDPTPASETPEPAPATTPEPAPGNETTASPEAKPAQLSAAVTLGDPVLTAGIPGDGPLSVEEIKTWLATPGIHDPLQVTLPLGLSLAAAQISGIEENPLTRAKIELGRQLYFDGRLSADGSISCASCHAPETGWTAPTQFGVGVGGQVGGRNSPVSFNRIISKLQFWDGRAADLEAQAVGPIANPIEMANTHEAAVKTIGDIEGYRLQFAAVFGADGLNIDNIGKALATFERAVVTGPSPYDYYNALKPFVDQFPNQEELDLLKEDDPDLFARYEQVKAESDAHPISESAVRGLTLFFSEKASCTACHAGANFTDEQYHNLGVGMDQENPDLGRFVVTGEEKDKGAFKTPTIRNIVQSAPYMHDGSQKTLMEVVEWYAKGGHPNPHLSPKMKKLELTEQDKLDLVAFMEACTGPFPPIQTGRLPQ